MTVDPEVLSANFWLPIEKKISIRRAQVLLLCDVALHFRWFNMVRDLLESWRDSKNQASSIEHLARVRHLSHLGLLRRFTGSLVV